MLAALVCLKKVRKVCAANKLKSDSRTSTDALGSAAGGLCWKVLERSREGKNMRIKYYHYISYSIVTLVKERCELQLKGMVRV